METSKERLQGAMKAVLTSNEERNILNADQREKDELIRQFDRRKQGAINTTQNRRRETGKHQRKPGLLQRLKDWRDRREMIMVVQFRKWLRIPAMMSRMQSHDHEIAGLRRDHEAAIMEINRLRGELQQLEQHLKLTRLRQSSTAYSLMPMSLLDPRKRQRSRKGNRK